MHLKSPINVFMSSVFLISVMYFQIKKKLAFLDLMSQSELLFVTYSYYLKGGCICGRDIVILDRIWWSKSYIQPNKIINICGPFWKKTALLACIYLLKVCLLTFRAT